MAATTERLPAETTGNSPITSSFMDRRNSDSGMVTPPSHERRQFANSHDDLSPDACELAMAIDEYKLRHRRRFITYEEMLTVIHGLGYSR